MRSKIFFLASSFLLACGTTSRTSNPAPDSGSPPVADGGSGTGGVDAGVGGDDAGVGPGGGGAADAGAGGGTAASDCDGLAPQTPGAPSQFKLVNQDLTSGACFPGETDGTGHIAVSFQNAFQPHDSDYTFVDPATSTNVGSFRGTRLFLIGQAGGFIGGECAGADCEQRVDVLGPTGRRLNETSLEESGNGVQANDPTGGMIRARLSRDDDHGRDDDRSATVLLDAIDASGRVRWTRPLPERFPAGEEGHLLIGVDRKGNVLALWRTSEGRFGANTWAGQWFGHDGAGGPEFQALPAGATPTALYERVDSGLFVAGVASAGSSPGWLGQFEPLATSMSAAPSWLASRPGVALHMVHGGAGYALLPLPGASAACEQDVEVVSRSGQSCGTARFAVGGGSCTTSSIAVGYDGTVVQQLPREREAACTAAGHQCDCTYRFWPGFFR